MEVDVPLDDGDRRHDRGVKLEKAGFRRVLDICDPLAVPALIFNVPACDTRIFGHDCRLGQG